MAPWIVCFEGRDHVSGSDFIMTGVEKEEDEYGPLRGPDFELFGATRADLEFIAHARQDIPALLSYIAELEDRLRLVDRDGR